MSSRFQIAALVGAPFYPNSVVWSEENLVAIASGHIVTILNPAIVDGPRGVITASHGPPFDVGTVERNDLFTSCLMHACLSRDVRPCVRSISWSPQGMAPNSGCLLAVCTTDGRVKLYHAPYYDFRAEWIEVKDLSDLLFGYCASSNFGELNMESAKRSLEPTNVNFVTVDGHTKVNSEHPIKFLKCSRVVKHNLSHADVKVMTVSTEMIFVSAIFEVGTSVEVLKQNGVQRIWVGGRIERIENGNALVRFAGTTSDEPEDELVTLNPESDAIKELRIPDCIPTGRSPFLKSIRPLIGLGHLPREIFVAEHEQGISEVLRIGEPIEAWISNRWVEGVFIGYSDKGLMMNFDGDSGTIALIPENVRLAPIWRIDKNSWQVTVVRIGLEEQATSTAINLNPVSFLNSQVQNLPLTSEEESLKRGGSNSLITAEQYASRMALLSSLIVAWSPLIRSSTESDPDLHKSSSSNCTVLAVGGKSGKVCFWRTAEPRAYAIENSKISLDVMFIGLLEAHNSWITAISWGICMVDSNPMLLLATGSSDGSVKVWSGDALCVSKHSKLNEPSFTLWKEIIKVDSIPVSAISLGVPSKSRNKFLLAVGKGSGLLEVYECLLSSTKFHIAGHVDAHDQVVTGVTWAFDCSFLYSCSQDNSVRCWILHGSSLDPLPFPLSSPSLAFDNHKNSADIPLHVFDSCFGFALSPGNLVLATVRSVDTELVDPMYQSRSLKAVVEFFWIGGQQMEVSTELSLYVEDKDLDDFSEMDLRCWNSNILWSLQQLDCIEKPLIVWDVIEALMAFKKLEPRFVEELLFKWISKCSGSTQEILSLEMILSSEPNILSKLSTRKMHLLNIICRRLIVPKVEAATLNNGVYGLVGVNGEEHEQLDLWVKLLNICESRLRDWLVGLTFSAVIYCASCTTQVLSNDGSCWIPAGVAQMEKWLALNNQQVSHELKVLEAELGRLRKLLPLICDYVEEEKCAYCSAPVPFESAEVASCKASDCDRRSKGGHKLPRCAISMQVCPAIPLWHCICCKRWASKHAPSIFFTVPPVLKDVNLLSKSVLLQALPKPLCPFCGILMQRLLPEFLLSASPV
ncbi:uncharacterized protein LOC18427718 [Amborella trichopoda]|uniref:uncharacterized protein LOC18427718 n=1 Tax=Amborella trichopoda TaxID=13333 RepID=UPI0005D328F7|nr:uncharacterized protein LOC18427718 [Amborella trichopoda]XP_020519043.1 uncharacterized protein LOC18427718 [Amborella trichopoda]|eukprot:XP_011621037.1 uncharacterized protein LOC18427718 [Amborella trichopoda]